LNLEPHALELRGRRHGARRRELPQPLVAGKLAGRRRELRRDQRLLQDRRHVVGGLTRQAEHLGQPQGRRLVAQLRIEVVDAQLVGLIRLAKGVGRAVELIAALLRRTHQRVFFLLRRFAFVLGAALLGELILGGPILLDLPQQVLMRRNLRLCENGSREDDCRDGQ
jgi:hypothetical protein